MATDWREGYRAAITEVVLAEGSPMRMDGDRPNYYGWHDWEVMKHLRPWDPKEPPCAITLDEGATFTEHTFDQFQGTFYEGDESESFIMLSGVSCSCGEHKGIPWAYEGNTGELIVRLLKEESS